MLTTIRSPKGAQTDTQDKEKLRKRVHLSPVINSSLEIPQVLDRSMRFVEEPVTHHPKD